MSEDISPKESGAIRPAGKRQVAGASTVSSASYTAQRRSAERAADREETPGGGVAAFPGEVVSEVRKVIWPTGREMAVYTTVVFAFLIVLTALVWGVDQLASWGVEAVLTP